MTFAAHSDRLARQMKLYGETAATVAPYLAWMALMLALPATAPCYALRSAATAALLMLYAARGRMHVDRSAVPGMIGFGVAVGFAVFALWVFPERFEVYRRLFVLGGGATPAGPSPYDPSVCGWPLAITRLAGSAFVIAPAEELFFRNFLYRWLQKGGDWTSSSLRRFDASAFLWTVALFALEHDRYLAGAMAGAAYGLLAIRKGLGAAIVAHVTTNLVLGMYVIVRQAWAFW